MFLQITVINAENRQTLLTYLNEAVRFVSSVNFNETQRAEYISKNTKDEEKVRVIIE